MTAIPGTNIAAKIAPFDTNDIYATHEAQWGRDGYRSVANITERNAITADRRKEGMLVYTLADDTVWQLYGGITNSNWRTFSSSEAAIFGVVNCDTTNFVYVVSNSRVTSGAVIDVTVKLPSISANQYQCSLANIVSGSFAMVLSSIPEVTGYSIHWTVQNPT